MRRVEFEWIVEGSVGRHQSVCDVRIVLCDRGEYLLIYCDILAVQLFLVKVFFVF